MNEKIIIKVPATSANLGPGFDSMGIALSLFNTFSFRKSNHYEFINMIPKYGNVKNLVVRSARKTYEYLNVKEIPFKMSNDENVPISRGLGSSATCIVAGIMIANYFAQGNLSKDEILNIATSIEGHPDNVAPAIFGNLVCSFKADNKIIHMEYKISQDLFFTVFVPNTFLSTQISRGVLPNKLWYRDIVYSLSRAINIPKALENKDIDKLFYLLDDKLHQPFRLPLISESDKISEFAKENKIPFCLSGSGSTLLMISDKSIIEKAKAIDFTNNWDIKELKVNDSGAKLEVINDEK